MASRALEAIPVGPFELQEIVGVGGMGKVWRGIHRAERVDVAVKVLTARGARDPIYLKFFRNEVRSVAGLDHPNIVTVFDHGVVSRETAEHAPRELIAGSPYLVMEHASGPTLVERLPMSSWAELRDVTLALLDALAHAHARGIIHRDLKPANVLFAGEGDLRPGLKLVDFGIARPPEGDEEMGWQTGTPGFMAPEQITADSTALGPWTDLYALGTILFRAAGGAPPFQASDRTELMQAHLTRTVPPLFALFPVPDGFEDWLRALLAKRPDQRFQRAADAAHALVGLGLPRSAAVPGADAASVGNEAATIAERVTALAGLRGWRTPESPFPAVSEQTPTHELPPLPARWQRPSRASLRLHGAGLGVYGLRSLPMVDREYERDSLWQALHRVHDRQRAEAVCLLGPAGFGKSRLAAWLSRRAHEVGGATVMRAVHGESPAPAQGLVAALAAHFGARGLPWGDAYGHLRRVLHHLGILASEDNRSLAEMIASAAQGPADDTSTPTALAVPERVERWLLLRSVLERLADRRPVLLWLDDVQWGQDALGFTQRLMDVQTERPGRILVVMTAREEALPERPVEMQLLEQLRADDGVSTLRIGPLAPADRHVLLEELLGLDNALAARIQEHTAGNPLFAVQLVGSLIQGEQLRLGPGGFELRPGAELALPEDVTSVWSQRIARLMQSFGAADWHAIELAALLGQEVNAEEWRLACRAAGLEPSPALIEAWLSERLAQSVPGGLDHGWSFSHGMLQESLVSRARDGGRLAAHHRACAQVLRESYAPQAQERLGRHLLAAGDLLAAIDPLMAGATERETAGDIQSAGALLRDRETAMEKIGLDPADERWGRGWVLQGRVAQLAGSGQEVEDCTRRAEEEAVRHGWAWTAAAAALNRGRIPLRGGEPRKALPILEEAVERAVVSGDRRLLAECRRALAGSLQVLGALDASVECYYQALEDSNAIGDDRGAGSAYLGLGLDATARDDLDAARQCFEHANARFSAIGTRWGTAMALSFLGDVARFRGDFEAAESLYTEAIDLHLSLGHHNAFLAMLNLAALWIESGDFQAALAQHDRVARISARMGWEALAGVGHVHRAAALGGLGRWPESLVELDAARRSIDASHFRDSDIGRLSRIAGDIAAAAGQVAAARLAYDIALGQWESLGREADAEETRAKRDALEMPQ